MSDAPKKQNLSPADIEAEARKIRAERIENLQDPKARQTIADVEKERTAKIHEIREQQKEKFEGKVETALEARKLSRNSPQPAPGGMTPSPILHKATEDYHRSLLQSQLRVSDNAYIKSQEKLYDQKIDQILDKAEGKSPPSHTTPGSGDGDRHPPDPSSPTPSPASPGGAKPPPDPPPTPPGLGPSCPSGHPRDYSVLKEQSARVPEPTQERTLKRFEDRHPEPAQAKTAERGQDAKAATPTKQEAQEKPHERKLVRFEDRHPPTKGRDVER